MVENNIVSLGDIEDGSEQLEELLQEIREGAAQATFYVEKGDGTLLVSSSRRDPRDLLVDLHRIQDFCKLVVQEML